MSKSVPSKTKDIFQKSKWIWPQDHRWDMHNAYALFRKEFDLDKTPAQAPLFITADQSYQLYINGRYICRGPARGFQDHWPYDEVDVAKYLVKGKNLIAIRAHNPGFSNFQYLTQGYAGLLLAAQWGKTTIVSDESWKARRQTGVVTGTVPTSLQLFCQEHIDLNVESPDWMKASYDDSQWNPQIAVHPWDGMPWYRLEERGIPMLHEAVWDQKTRVVGIAQGSNYEGYKSARDVARLRYKEGLKHEKGEFSAELLRVEPTGSGKYRSYLIDFGKTVIGSVGFKVSGASGGEILDTLHMETVDKETLTPHYEPDKHCRMAFGHRLICRPGNQDHTFYHPFGFRYMVLTIRDNKSILEITPYLRTVMYPHSQKGSFQSSDSTLKNIWDACVWTERVCSMDAYVDTPWREQAQWWGDARIQAKNTFFFSGDARLFRRGIYQIGAQSAPNGLTYGHSPTMAHNCVLPDFTLIWFITMWDYYWQTGDLTPFLENQQPILTALKYFDDKANEGKIGLLSYDPRYWLFLDWTNLFKDGYSTIYNIWWLIALEKLSEMYKAARKTAEAKKLSTQASKLRKILVKLIGKDGLIFDGYTYEGKLVKETSIHAQTMAIMAGLQTKTDKARLEQSLLPYIRGHQDPKIRPSCYWVNYIFEVLAQYGHGHKVIEFIRNKWKPMAEHGTTWEVFEPTLANESFSHAWSAHPLYHFMQTIGGIRQSDIAWKRISFSPVFYGEKGGATIPTPQGAIVSSWERKDSKVSLLLSLPKGVVADINLPGLKPSKVSGKKTWTLKIS